MAHDVRFYKSFEDDFVTSARQQYRLSEDYEWVRSGFFHRIACALVYALALVFANVYCRLFLHVRIKGAGRLRREKNGAFVFGNHTQTIGDVFSPALACFPRRIYTLASPANLGIPVLGRILPYLGALPLAHSVSGMKKLNRAIGQRLSEGACIVVYPEAHVWDYCTFIRPFPATSFKLPLTFSRPVYSMTATYQKRPFSKKPRITIYIDGPFAADSAAALCSAVHECMTERSQLSDCRYIEYLPEKSPLR